MDIDVYGEDGEFKFTFSISDEEALIIERLSEVSGIPVEDIILSALEKYLDEEEERDNDDPK